MPECLDLKPEKLDIFLPFEHMHLFLLGAPKRICEYIFNLFKVSDDPKKGTKRLRAAKKSIEWCETTFNGRIGSFKAACLSRHDSVSSKKVRRVLMFNRVPLYPFIS